MTASATPLKPQRATVYRKGQQVVCTGSAAFIPPPAPSPATFTTFLLSLQPIQWCLDLVVVANEGLDLVEALRTGLSASVIAISDG
jgi:hypothetical protein